MATYTELRDLIRGLTDDQGLKGKVLVASLIKAEAILGEATPSMDRLAWASSALGNPDGVLEELFNAVIADNAGATITNITGATDAAIQTNVDDAIDALHP